MRFWMMLVLLGMGLGLAQSERVFRGYILIEPNFLLIRMHLKANGQKVSGYYIYESKNQPLRLEGTLNQSGLNLKEFDGTRQTGVFRGGYTEEGIEGDWYRPDGKVAGQFSLTEQDHAFTQSKLTTALIQDRAAALQVAYPQFSGKPSWQAINRQIAQSAQQGLKEYREEYITALQKKELSEMRSFTIDYTLLLGTERWVSLVLMGNACGPTGCAHPGSWINGYTFDSQSAKRVQLAQLFKSSNYLIPLVELAKANLKGVLEVRGLSSDEIKDTLDNLSVEDMQWALGRKGLWLYFSVPHYLGDYLSTLIEYNQIRDLLSVYGLAAFKR